MSKVLLSLHLVAVILAVGPVAVAASMFPAMARRDAANLPLLYRICKVYALVGIAVPVFGFAVAGTMKVTGNAWVLVSIALTAVAAAVLGLLVLPKQRHLVTATGPDTPAERAATVPLAMYTGLFNLLWVAVTVVMIVRPGSSTHV